jgi:hypothetical protein
VKQTFIATVYVAKVGLSVASVLKRVIVLEKPPVVIVMKAWGATTVNTLLPQKVHPSLVPYADETVSFMVRVWTTGIVERAVVAIVTRATNGALKVAVAQRSTIVTMKLASRFTTPGARGFVIDAR